MEKLNYNGHPYVCNPTQIQLEGKGEECTPLSLFLCDPMQNQSEKGRRSAFPSLESLWKFRSYHSTFNANWISLALT